MIEQIDANGNRSQREYDARGNLIKQINALGEETHYEYDAERQLTAITDALGRRTLFKYDAVGRIIEYIEPENPPYFYVPTWRFNYDAVGNLISKTDHTGYEFTDFRYDSRNNLIEQRNALGESEHYSYDSLNRLSEDTDPLGRVNEYNYDALSRLVEGVDPLGQSSTQSYDVDGQRDSFTDPNNHQTQFQFDSNGRLISEQVATGGTRSYTYNARDLLNTITNARGQQRTLSYDAAGRVIQSSDPDGTIQYTYDSNGNVLTISENGQTITRTYDALNRITAYTNGYGDTIRYAYDAVGNLTNLTYPDGKHVTYSYTIKDQLKTVTDWNGKLVASYTYDSKGRLQQIRKNYRSSYSYDLSTNYAYDKTGRISSIYHRINKTIWRMDTFSYDAAGNIIDEDIDYRSDALADLTLPNSIDMAYGAANTLTQFNSQSLNFDADGNLLQLPQTSGNDLTLSYDSRNRLTQAGNTTYNYDAENRRIAINGNRLVINPQPNLDQVLMQYHADNSVTYYIYGLGLIADSKNGNIRQYLHDYRGSTIALLDEDENILEQFAYSPFGELLAGDNTTTPFLYNGLYGVMTDENGLYHMRARYYSPTIKRFVNQDVLLGSISSGQSLNRYAFVTGDPVKHTDPFGLKTEDVLEVIKFLNKNVHDIKIEKVIFRTLPDNVDGMTTILSNEIILHPKYLESLCKEKDFMEMATTLLHESMHQMDSAWRRYLDARVQPQMTPNHDSIYDRTAWEMGDLNLGLELPEGKTWDDYDEFADQLDELYYSTFDRPLWGIPEGIRQKGNRSNPNSLRPALRELHQELYSCGCKDEGS